MTDNDLTTFFTASVAIFTPYSAAPTRATLAELWIDPATHKARVQWSKASTFDASGTVVLGVSPHLPGDIIAIPAALNVDETYLIWSEVSYKYVPAVGYVMAPAGITLSDQTFTRPRQFDCVIYKTGGCTRL